MRVDLAEEIGRAALHKKQEYDLLMGGYGRLQTVLERIVGKEVMEKPFEH